MQRINQILNHAGYLTYLELNAAEEVNRVFCHHDLRHALDVSRIAYILMLEDDGKATLADMALDMVAAKEIIYAAGLLHDIGRWQQYRSGQDHAAVGAVLALPILEAADFSLAKQKVIVTAIKEHRGASTKTNWLSRLISRADDLSRPCSFCQARQDCYKIKHMETAKGLIY